MKDTNLIIGKKNTGKTRNILFNEFKEAIDNNKNLLVYNDRDEYYTAFSKDLKEKNYNVLVLNLQDATKSNGYNPLLLPYFLYKENKIDDSVSMINNVALEMFKEETLKSDPFWEIMSANYFTGLVLILFKEARLEEINIGSIQVMMSQCESKYLDTTYLKKYLENIDVTSSIYSLLSSIVYAPAETKESIISVTRQKLNKYLLREQLLNLLNTNDINLNNLESKTAIFIIGNELINDISNIFIFQVINSIDKPFTFILDNFDTLRTNLSLNGLLKDASYKKNKVYISVHNEERFNEQYGKYIIDNFENILNLNEDSLKENSDYHDTKIENNNYEYPMLNMVKHEYLNFINFVESKYSK